MGNNRTMRNSKVAELPSASPSVETNSEECLLLHPGSVFVSLAEAWQWEKRGGTGLAHGEATAAMDVRF